MHEILDVRVWALETFYFNRVLLPHIEAGISLSSPDIPNDEYQERQKRLQAGATWNDNIGARMHEVKGKNIAHLPVIGPMTKRGGFWTYGSKEYVNTIKAANKDSSVDAILMEVDGPGGGVDGTEVFAHAVRDSEKPIVAFVDGMAASAHLWPTAQSDYVFISTGLTSWIGSIGTLLLYINQQEWLKQMGIKVEIIRAPQSKDKARVNSLEPLTKEAKEGLLEELKEITDLFIREVKEGRGSRLKKNAGEDIFTGKLYNGRDGVKYGLADKVGSIEDALEKAAELAGANKLSFLKSSNKSNSTDMKILSFLGLGKEVEGKLTDEQKQMLESADAKLAELEASVAEKESQIATLQGEKSAAEEKATNLETKVTNLEATIREKDQKIKTLEEKPDGKEAKAAKSGDENGESGKTRKPYSWEEKAQKKVSSLKNKE